MGHSEKHVRRRGRYAAFAAIALAAVIGAGPGTVASASTRTARKPPPSTTSTSSTSTSTTSTTTTTTVPPTPLTTTLAAQAQPDECFAGIGNPYPAIDGCAANNTFTYNSNTYNGQLKVSQSYPWSMQEVDGLIWLGTVPNILCQAGALDIGGGATTPSFLSKRLVCEYGSSAYGIANSLPASAGDSRPPQVLTYDLTTDLTTVDPLTTTTVVDRSPDDPLFRSTGGLRFAASTADLVLFGGPDLLLPQINFFAYKRSDLSYIGSFSDSAYTDVRRGVNAGGALYVGVANSGGGGSVLRWTGTAASPFSYTVVGAMDNDAAEIVLAGDRLAVGTWPNQLNGGLRFPPTSGVFISPVLGATGLDPSQATGWKKIWSADNYDGDVVTSRTYGIGGMAWFNNALYFGTVHWVNGALQAHNAVYGNLTSADGNPFWERLRGTLRSSILVRATNLSSRPRLTLLYGDQKLWQYSTGVWSQVNNGMGGGGGTLGRSGLGNPYNFYVWSLAQYQDRLYIGTLDARILYAGSSTWNKGITEGWLPAFTSPLGSDLFSLGTTGAAVLHNGDGFGNPYSYGIRNMLGNASGLWVGEANPFNLAFPSPTGDLGGWKLFRVNP